MNHMKFQLFNYFFTKNKTAAVSYTLNYWIISISVGEIKLSGEEVEDRNKRPRYKKGQVVRNVPEMKEF